MNSIEQNFVVFDFKKSHNITQNIALDIDIYVSKEDDPFFYYVYGNKRVKNIPRFLFMPTLSPLPLLPH